MSSGNKVFGKRIKELRERKKLTQEKLAEKVGLDLQTISRIETGYYFTSFENLEKLANALDVTMADLFNFGHLKTKEELIKEINTELSTSSEKDVQRIHKLIFGYLK
ncbi:MAG: helix-turn-helix transcriptional regulator [Clostridium sp.]|jgi:transcriptional regulator, XRE family|nr:helix-turn-helix transcriptional regulator [Clostridium sp.]